MLWKPNVSCHNGDIPFKGFAAAAEGEERAHAGLLASQEGGLGDWGHSPPGDKSDFFMKLSSSCQKGRERVNMALKLRQQFY